MPADQAESGAAQPLGAGAATPDGTPTKRGSRASVPAARTPSKGKAGRTPPAGPSPAPRAPNHPHHPLAHRGLGDASGAAPRAPFSDPYCVCQLQGKPKMRFRTRTITDCRTPIWNHSYVFTDWGPHDEVQFKLLDEDEDKSSGADDVLGNATFTSDMLDEHAAFSGVLPLQDPCLDGAVTRRASRGAGHLKVSVQVELAEDDDVFQEFRTRPRVRQSAAMQALQAEVNQLQQVLPDTVCTVDLVDCDLFNWEIALAGMQSYYDQVVREAWTRTVGEHHLGDAGAERSGAEYVLAYSPQPGKHGVRSIGSTGGNEEHEEDEEYEQERAEKQGKGGYRMDAVSVEFGAGACAATSALRGSLKDQNGTVCPSLVGHGDALQLVLGLLSLLTLPLPEQVRIVFKLGVRRLTHRVQAANSMIGNSGQAGQENPNAAYALKQVRRSAEGLSALNSESA
ncbi:unnamed protein product [Prorocentrum cordatum]|uniref:C2 domain-containing protein n=1 Tax=Prorocentrum cordatum TaxID=2364126 RepID=A0ABN9X0H7_9DINO|nr:unnamed protein product [Polarella glacialis]